MIERLSYTQDKFIFEVAGDRYYNAAGVWAVAAGSWVTVGVSDFFQKRHGDVAFAEVFEEGTMLAAGEAFANIETIKVDVDLPSPITGEILAVNQALEFEAELINRDPYGGGWLAVFEASDWPGDAQALMSPEAYFAYMKAELQGELG